MPAVKNQTLISSNSQQVMHKHLTNITNLGRDGTFDTAELLDGTIEVVSVADHNAHDKLHIRLYTDE